MNLPDPPAEVATCNTEQLAQTVYEDPLCDEYAASSFTTTTASRDRPPRQDRITDLIRSGKLFDDLGVAPGLTPKTTGSCSADP